MVLILSASSFMKLLVPTNPADMFFPAIWAFSGSCRLPDPPKGLYHGMQSRNNAQFSFPESPLFSSVHLDFVDPFYLDGA